ncbi:nitrate reductase cytochrome c-type subunit [Zooshikella sp. RANM57]|uniref:nitrate reductase cytochrome c-type subunit n=1 Tax=Zooshikella sp. RANM57 TaxID=3425863 RepID=UPI003D6DEE49
MNKIRLLFPALLLIAIVVFAEENITTLRPNQTITEEADPPSMANVLNTDIRQERNYPMQPPIIPHKIRNYQVDLNTNKCMSCHSRERTQASQAPMVSVTHFMDRDGNFRAEISPRRYFCQQCHVTQSNSTPMVKNLFKDMYEVIETNKN